MLPRRLLWPREQASRGPVQESTFSRRRFLVRLIVTAAACLSLLWFIDWGEVARTLAAADPGWLFAVFVVMNLDRLFMAYKWTILLRALDILVPLVTAIKAYYVATFWGNFLPSGIGGDVVRIGWMKRQGAHTIPITSTIAAERVLGALALLVVASACVVPLSQYAPSADHRSVFLVVGLGGGACLLVTYLILSKRMDRLLKGILSILPSRWTIVGKIVSATLLLRDRPGALVRFFVLSIVEQGFPILSVYFTGRALGLDLPLFLAVIGVPIILLVARLPISIKGFGVQEGLFALVFSLAGVSVSASITMSLMDRVLMIFSSSPGIVWTPSSRASRELPSEGAI